MAKLAESQTLVGITTSKPEHSFFFTLLSDDTLKPRQVLNGPNKSFLNLPQVETVARVCPIQDVMGLTVLKPNSTADITVNNTQFSTNGVCNLRVNRIANPDHQPGLTYTISGANPLPRANLNLLDDMSIFSNLPDSVALTHPDLLKMGIFEVIITRVTLT